MSLAKLMENRFRGDIRHRGQTYFKTGRVSITRVTPDNVYAVVRDGVEHQTQVSRSKGDLDLFCSSVEGTNRPPYTKYVWATILAIDDAGYTTGQIRPGSIPPFVHEDVFTIKGIADDEYDDEEDAHLFAVSQSRTAAVAATTPRVDVPAWQRKLHDLQGELNQGGFSKPLVERDTEILYEIDIARSRQVKMLVIQTSQRQRRANGQWGRLKPLKLRPNEFDQVDSARDRQILAYLCGGTPERESPTGQPIDRLPVMYRFRLSFELCGLILPLMFSTGRVRYLGEEEKRKQPLVWDEHPESWEFTLHVDFNETTKHWIAQPVFLRGNDVLNYADTRLVLPGGLVFTENQVSKLEDYGAYAWIDSLSDQNWLEVEDGEQQKLVERLWEMPLLPRLELPDELQLEEVRIKPEPVLSVIMPQTQQGWRQDLLHATVEFTYDETRIRGSQTRWAIVKPSEQKCYIRDREQEKTYWSRLQELGFRRLIDVRHDHYDAEVHPRDLGPAIRELMTDGWNVMAEGQPIHQPQGIQFRVQSGIDWFELTGKVDFEGRSVPFPELLSALVRGDTVIRFDDGTYGLIPEAWRAQYAVLAGLGTMEGDAIRFSSTQISLLDALLVTQESVEYDERFLEMRQKITSFQGVDHARESSLFKGELRPYQREGLGWLQFLSEFAWGGCLADDMGLGKTIQVLALLLERVESKKTNKPSLIVVPKSLMFNWMQEAERFAPLLKVLDYTGGERQQARSNFSEFNLILTTYGTLRRDVLELKDCEFDYVILDEAQTIKNSTSQIAKSSRLLKADYRLALSGTPIENHLGDLWSIFEFLNPGMLGRSSAFKMLTADIQNPAAQKLLSNAMRPFVLRRTKQQVATELPEKLEETLYCEMEEDQQRLYNELRDHYRQSLLGMIEEQGIGKSKMHILEALLRLRQAACHPALLDRASKDIPFAKLGVLCPYLEELVSEGHKALVFSQFTSMLSIARQHLEQLGINYVYLDGQTRHRKKVIQQFQEDPNVGVFLISLKAGGLGLNLTAADYVFLLDPWWNPAVEAQAIDRSHRVGQTKPVFAYRMICRGTIEEKIAKLQVQKKKLADAILEVEGNILKDMTREDLELLLS
jgi:superfamily II DNA or RNA helicase